MSVRQNVYWSNEVKIITILTTGILLFAVSTLIKNIDILSSFVLVIIVVTFFVCMLNAPLFITIDESRVRLKKLLGEVAIEYTDITEVDLYTPQSGSIRLFGSGGYGEFHRIAKSCSDSIGAYKRCSRIRFVARL